MPTSVIVNGKRVYRPSVQATIDTSALGGKGTSLGNLALVADLPGFKQSTIKKFADQKALTDYDPTNDELKLLAQLAFSPSNDPAIPGGASTLYVVSTSTNTQAFWDALDANGAVALNFKSKPWGVVGNRLRRTLLIGASLYTITLVRDGVTEIVEIKTPQLGTVQYTLAVLTTAIIEWTATQVRYEWTRLIGPKLVGPAAPLVVATDWDHSPCAGVIGITLDAGLGVAHPTDVTVSIIGTDLAGAPQTDLVTIATGGNTGVTLAVFGSITTSVTVDCPDTDAWVGNATLECVNGRVIINTGRRIDSIISELGQIPGITGTKLDPTAGKYDAADADLTDGEIDAKGVAFSVRADMKMIVDGFAVSQLAEVTRGASGLVLAAAADANFLGGTEASPVGTVDWTAALLQIEDQDVQVVTCLDDQAAVHALIPTHCNAAALLGHERNGWAGGLGGETKAAFIARTKALNTQYVSLVGDQMKVNHPNGTTPTLEPEYLALAWAAAQCGSPIAWPLTKNSIQALDFVQTWAPNRDADELLAAGCVIMTQDSLGWTMERDITTYLTDDNAFRSGRSAWESLQTCVRDLRNELNSRIGNPVVSGSAKLVKRKAGERLDAQVQLGWIKAWRNLTLADLGDRFQIKFEAAPTEELAFIELGVTAVRIPGS